MAASLSDKQSVLSKWPKISGAYFICDTDRTPIFSFHSIYSKLEIKIGLWQSFNVQKRLVRSFSIQIIRISLTIDKIKIAIQTKKDCQEKKKIENCQTNTPHAFQCL